jgi:DNA repair protein RadC
MHEGEESPRERILCRGSDSLSDAELLAVLLDGPVAGPGLGVARNLLQHAGGLEALLRLSATEWLRSAELTRPGAARMIAALELGRRYLSDANAIRERMVGPACAARYFHARLSDRAQEIFGCLFLDTRHRLIVYEELFRGTVDGATVHAREVVKRALYHNAAAVIAGHNHPSGVAEPSEADRSITLRLAKALALVDVRLLDHVVVARGGHASLADRGWL